MSQKLGTVIRERRGQRTVDVINPTVGWNGGEDARQKAVRKAPNLQTA